MSATEHTEPTPTDGEPDTKSGPAPESTSDAKTSGHSTADTQTERNAEDESPG